MTIDRTTVSNASMQVWVTYLIKSVTGHEVDVNAHAIVYFNDYIPACDLIIQCDQRDGDEVAAFLRGLGIRSEHAKVESWGLREGRVVIALTRDDAITVFHAAEELQVRAVPDVSTIIYSAGGMMATIKLLWSALPMAERYRLLGKFTPRKFTV